MHIRRLPGYKYTSNFVLLFLRRTPFPKNGLGNLRKIINECVTVPRLGLLLYRHFNFYIVLAQNLFVRLIRFVTYIISSHIREPQGPRELENSVMLPLPRLLLRLSAGASSLQLLSLL